MGYRPISIWRSCYPVALCNHRRYTIITIIIVIVIIIIIIIIISLLLLFIIIIIIIIIITISVIVIVVVIIVIIPSMKYGSFVNGKHIGVHIVWREGRKKSFNGPKTHNILIAFQIVLDNFRFYRTCNRFHSDLSMQVVSYKPIIFL